MNEAERKWRSEMTRSLGELRLAVDALYRRLEQLEQDQQKPPDNVTASPPPEWEDHATGYGMSLTGMTPAEEYSLRKYQP